MLIFLIVGCADASTTAADPDLGTEDAVVQLDDSSDVLPDSQDIGRDFDMLERVQTPFCNSESAPIQAVRIDQEFRFPALIENTRDLMGPIWIFLLTGASSNLIVVLGDEGRERMIGGIWLPFGAPLKFNLGDHYPYTEPPEIVPEYLAVSVLVDHQKVLADYEWKWKNEDFNVQDSFMSVPHQTTQFVDVTIPASVFPEARAYDVVVLFFKPNAGRKQLVQMFRMTLYYGGFDIPEHPCVPLAETPVLTPKEAAYQQLTATLIPRDDISVYFDDPAESMTKDSVIEVDKNATNVQMNVLLRGTRGKENFILDHVPMKIVTFVDYVAQEDPILIGLPQETRDFAHREKIEIPLNPGPETIVWVVGIYNPWIPAVSWDNQINRDIQRLYWAYTSNRIILRRSE